MLCSSPIATPTAPCASSLQTSYGCGEPIAAAAVARPAAGAATVALIVVAALAEAAHVAEVPVTSLGKALQQFLILCIKQATQLP